MDEDSDVPILKVPERQVIALEHPMIIKNLENGIKTFGRNRPFQRIYDSRNAKDIIPLYLRYDDPMCTPILSHNSATNNLLLKITVPKRTGRKRKRGSKEPYQDVLPVIGATENVHENDDQGDGEDDDQKVQSHSRMDEPSSLLRKLRDTKDSYKLEVAGQITQSHRYRGVSDFQHSLSNTDFMPKFRDATLARDAEQLRQFKFNPSKGWKPNEDFIPAPILTLQQLPFNWGWHQNANIYTVVDEATGQKKLINRQGAKKVKLEYLGQDVESIPMRPHSTPPDDPGLLGMIENLRQALEERPLYTRRALVNRVGLSKDLWMFRDAIQYVGYQFKGGPFRDAVIRLGVDPRSDPKYRPYQTFFFKLFEEEEKVEGMQWKDVRTSYTINRKGATKEDRDSHIFDGKSLVLDGKIWQACDITDPLLSRLIRDAPYRDTCDNVSDGWYPPGTMAKIRAIMKTKLMAVCCKRDLTDEDFAAALRVPDFDPKKKSKGIAVPVPKVGFTMKEIEEMRKQGLTKAVQSSGLRNAGLAVEGKSRSARIRPHVGHGHVPKSRKPPSNKKPEREILQRPSPAPASSSWVPIAPAPVPSLNVPDSWIPIAPAPTPGSIAPTPWVPLASSPLPTSSAPIAWAPNTPTPLLTSIASNSWAQIAPAPVPTSIGPDGWGPIAPSPSFVPIPEQVPEFDFHSDLRDSSADPMTRFMEDETFEDAPVYMDSIENELIYEDGNDDRNEDEDHDEDNRSEDDGTDIEQNEISDGAASDSEATDIVDYRSIYTTAATAQ